MDVEVFENTTTPSDTSWEVYKEEQRFYARLFLELFTLVGLLAIISNFLMAFVIIKFRKLRKVVTNQILLHINILQSVYMFTSPLTLRLTHELDSLFENAWFSVTICIMNDIESVIFFATILVLILLLCDWYIKTYNKNKYKTFEKVYKFFVALIYAVIVCVPPVTFRMCSPWTYFTFTILVVVLAHLVMILALIIINIVHKFKSRRLSHNTNNTGLAVSNIVFFLWAPTFFVLLITATVGLNIQVAIIIFSLVGFSNPIFIFLYLFYTDDGFNVCLKKVFSCRCNDYENETLEESISYNDVSGVHIS